MGDVSAKMANRISLLSWEPRWPISVRLLKNSWNCFYISVQLENSTQKKGILRKSGGYYSVSLIKHASNSLSFHVIMSELPLERLLPTKSSLACLNIISCLWWSVLIFLLYSEVYSNLIQFFDDISSTPWFSKSL